MTQVSRCCIQFLADSLRLIRLDQSESCNPEEENQSGANILSDPKEVQ